MTKTNLWASVWLGIASVVASSPNVSADPPVTRRGTSVMHYMTRNVLGSTNGSSDVGGTIRLQSNEQGNSAKEMLDIRVTGLEADAAYRLLALMGDDTNALVVGEFSADGSGNARLSFMSKGRGRGGKSPVPESLSPLTDLRALGIENAATQTVAHAWIADSENFQYLVKRNLEAEDSSGSAAGSFSLIANAKKVNFRLLAGGLTAGNDYHLVLNGESKAVVQPNADGRVEIRTWPMDAPAVLELRSLAIWDAGSNVVLRTTLPR